MLNLDKLTYWLFHRDIYLKTIFANTNLVMEFQHPVLETNTLYIVNGNKMETVEQRNN